MRVIRFEDHAGRVHLGSWPSDGKAQVLDGDLFTGLKPTAEVAAVRRFLAPLAPVDLIGVGLNYRRHAEESVGLSKPGGSVFPNAPVIFSKLTSCVIGPGDDIVLPDDAPDEVDYEAELAVIIGRSARKVSADRILDYVLGYTCANDVSARDCQRVRDKQWTRAKSFDTFCPLGPAILLAAGVDPAAMTVRGRLNGQVVQDSDTADMIFSVPVLLSYLSHQFTLRPGTVVLTGTPGGVGMGRTPPRYLRDGDTYSVEIEGIGELTNQVRSPR